jgi:hypothetical protein
MRVPVVLVASVAILLAASRPAVADDAGNEGSSEPAPADAASGDAEARDAAAGDAAPEQGDVEVGDGAPIAVVACDGALCDTVQGRPSCAMAAGSLARTEADPVAIAGVASALALALTRRTRRGT